MNLTHFLIKKVPIEVLGIDNAIEVKEKKENCKLIDNLNFGFDSTLEKKNLNRYSLEQISENNFDSDWDFNCNFNLQKEKTNKFNYTNQKILDFLNYNRLINVEQNNALIIQRHIRKFIFRKKCLMILR